VIRYALILLFFLFSLPTFAEYKGLKKLSKNNSFMDEKGKPYSDEEIIDKENTLLIIWNHGSDPDATIDKCKAKPKWGYQWHGAVVPVIARMHNKKINNLEIKIYRLCSGVRGLAVHQQDHLYNTYQPGTKLKLHPKWEYKQLKRQNIILSKADEFLESGFKNIVLIGYSAGGWASLILQSQHPEKFKGAVALNPAFAGPKKEWQKEFPAWGGLRDLQIDMFKESESLNALVFFHSKDLFEDSETLSFLKKFNDINLIDYSEVDPTSCTWSDVDKKMPAHEGHAIPTSECFTEYVEKNNYIINYLESIF
jgi:hypothetical protein